MSDPPLSETQLVFVQMQSVLTHDDTPNVNLLEYKLQNKHTQVAPPEKSIAFVANYGNIGSYRSHVFVLKS